MPGNGQAAVAAATAPGNNAPMARLPDVQTLIAELIAAPSVSSADPRLDTGNLQVLHRLGGWLEDLGFAVAILPAGEDPAKGNLVATLGRGEGGLVLAGHGDTVPWDEGRWSQDPFRLTERDGRLYGLGTSDMKSFLALAVAAARHLDPRRLRRPLTLLATADEETSMAGARALVARGASLGRHAVVGEPTGLRPVRAHKGMMTERLRLVGRSGHSSDPALGASALEGMQRVMAALLAWRDELQAGHRDPRFGVPFPTLNLGHIHGGDNANRICGRCELHLDLRPLPGMAVAALREELRHLAREAVAGLDLRLEAEALFEGVDALETPAESDIVAVAESLTGEEAGAVAFGTEAPYLQRLGLDPVVLGPGDIAQAHQPDEYLAVERVEPTIALLRSLVERLCVAEAPAPGAKG